MIRIAIAEEHRIVRWALRQALTYAGDFYVVGEAGTLEETLAMIAEAKPEVLVVDPTIPDHGCADVLAAIRQVDHGPSMVVLGSHGDPSYAARAIAVGAHAYVSKSADPMILIDAIRAVARGEQVVPADAERLLAAGEKDPAAVLTNREIQVMEMLARGLTNREIAEHLTISVKTVDTHRGHVLKKLHVRNNSELTRFAVKYGYVTA
ncbi:MAG: response regulator transcription factor [Kofleriaceae bacterium]